MSTTATSVDVFAHRGAFFRVLQTTPRCQTAVMTIAPGADAGLPEEHAGDQVIYVEGEASVHVDDAQHAAPAGALVLIPARTRHSVRDVGRTPLFFVTMYAPPAY